MTRLPMLILIFYVFIVQNTKFFSVLASQHPNPEHKSYVIAPDTQRLEARTPPEFSFYDHFEFYQFWTKNEEDMVKEAVAGAIDIVQIALRGLGGDLGDSGPHGEDDPSYKRYFDPGYLKVVGGVYQSILAALGAPNTQAIRDCISAVKMQFIYGDYIGSPTNSCAKGTVMAYYGFYGDKNGVTRSVICFCKLFFDTFRTHKPLAQLPNVPSPKKSNLKAYVDDISSRERFPEVDSGASTVLHECLHWWDITRGVLGDQSITDVEVQRPGTQVITKAYRPFYATKCKDATWRPQYGPLFNADNYVYLALEIYYRWYFELGQWEDSPDPVGEVASPHIPPARMNSPPA